MCDVTFLCDGLTFECCAPDSDLDGVCDQNNCAVDDASAFATPGEIANVQWPAGNVTVAWNPAAPAWGDGTVYDVLRGNCAELPVGAGLDEVCLITTEPDPDAQDPDVPVSGQCRYYVVRGSNACGLGTYGFESAGPERLSAVCP